MKKRIRKRRPQTVEQLKSCIHQEWAKIKLAKLQQWISSVPKRLQSVIKRKGDTKPFLSVFQASIYTFVCIVTLLPTTWGAVYKEGEQCTMWFLPGGSLVSAYFFSASFLSNVTTQSHESSSCWSLLIEALQPSALCPSGVWYFSTLRRGPHIVQYLTNIIKLISENTENVFFVLLCPLSC